MTEKTIPDVHEINRYEALFQHASVGIIIVGTKGEIIAANPFLQELFHYTEKELLGKTIEILIPSRYRDKHIDHRNQFNKHPQNRPMGIGRDLYGQKKDGSEFPVEISLAHYRLNNEEKTIAFVNDISVRKKAEAEFERLNDELEEMVEKRTGELQLAMTELEKSKEELTRLLQKEKDLSELKSRFVSMASHEFRTPLSTVLSSAYLVQKYTAGDEQHKREKHLQRILSSVNMMTDILNDFLSVGKIEEGKIQVRLADFDLEKITDIVVQEMQTNAKEGQKISYRHSGPADVNLDASLLRHIEMNLISNAIKFSPENTFIEVNTAVDKHTISFSVKDAGIGISAEDRQHLMERFFRGANATNIQGTGLGLHIVSKYAELMYGKVDCKSELEKGTEFVVTFSKNH
jgi:PAS domain S-box-containing protein